jgi:ribosomal-protein-alanine N-acetyltransferase
MRGGQGLRAATFETRGRDGTMGTELARLRPVAEADLELLERLTVEPDLVGPLAWYGYGDRGAIRRRFGQDGFLAEDYGRLMVDTPAAGGGAVETVGLVSWHAVAHGPGQGSRCWNIGIGLVPHARNRGIGTAAQRALAEYLFQVTPVMRVEAATLAENAAEQRALEKAGFTRDGVLRAAQFLGGAYRDVVVYSRLRTD